MPVPIHALMRLVLHRPQTATSERAFLEEAARRALGEQQRARQAQRARPGRSVRAFLARKGSAPIASIQPDPAAHARWASRTDRRR